MSFSNCPTYRSKHTKHEDHEEDEVDLFFLPHFDVICYRRCYFIYDTDKMKVKRQKKFQKAMSFYTENFGFRAPYNVLLDGTFAKAALDNKVNLRDQLPKYLEGGVRLVTTACVLEETERLGPEVYGAVQVLKQCSIRKCSHPKSSSTRGAPRCICGLVQVGGEGDKYIVATQDYTLRVKLQTECPGVPLLQLCGAAPTLEKPSEASRAFVESQMQKKVEVLSYQREILNHLKEDAKLIGVEGVERKGTRKRKRAGPNPLSCKKSKKSKPKFIAVSVPNQGEEGGGLIDKKKRSRKRVKVPKHVKEELAK